MRVAAVTPAASRVLTSKACDAAHHVHCSTADCVIDAAAKQQGAICASGGGPACWGPHPVAEHRVDPGSQEQGVHLQAGVLSHWQGVQQHRRSACLARRPPGRQAVATREVGSAHLRSAGQGSGTGVHVIGILVMGSACDCRRSDNQRRGAGWSQEVANRQHASAGMLYSTPNLR